MFFGIFYTICKDINTKLYALIYKVNQTDFRIDTMDRLPTLCLNMIVKNESKVITRLLESVAPIVDSFCICDTGSTDDTVNIIQNFFKERRIPGKIVYEPFKDFGHNRSFAMNAAATLVPGSADYLLLMDADMILQINPEFSVKEFKTRLARLNAFHLYQGSDTFNYKNTRIVKNNMGFSYWGVTHEYVKVPDGVTMSYGTFEIKELFIRDIGDGGSKADKFERDIRLLEQGLVDNPNNDRYTFYLANSYRDKGDHQKAIEVYKKRVEIGGWVEEIWQSHYNIGKLYRILGNMPAAISAWMDAYHAYPNRIENLYEIINHYRVAGKNTLAYHFFLLAEESRTKWPARDYLFTQLDMYEYKLDYELSIIGYYCNKQNHDLMQACMTTIAHKAVPDGIYRNVLTNYKFYAPNITKYALPLHESNTKILQSIGQELFAPYLGDFVSSTPSVCIDTKTGDLVVCVRYVDYKITDKGEYTNNRTIVTKNAVARFGNVTGDYTKIWEKRPREYELKHDTTYDGRYVGLEDVRLFSYDKKSGIGEGRGRLIYNANRGLEGTAVPPASHTTAKMVVEHGWIVYDAAADTLQTVNSHILSYDRQQPELEKNWVLFGGQEPAAILDDLETDEETRVTLKGVYSWSPLVIGTVCPNAGTFTETHRIDTVPYFFKNVRCSTCGVAIGDEIWFICHLVNYEDRRYYYHLIVVLDSKTYALKKYTKLWRFEKETKVEYTLGFVHFSDYNRFLIGYSVMDRETKYTMISKHVFDEMMILC